MQSLAPVAALLISASILLMGQGLLGILLPVRAMLEAFSTMTIGAMGAGYFLGFTLGCLKGGELVRSVGHVRVYLAMAALASAAPLLHSLVLQPWFWISLRLLTGFCLAVIYIVIESWLNERSTNQNRGLIFSAYAMITLTVLAVGQLMILMYDPSGMQLFAIASVLVSVAAIPVALSTAPMPNTPRTVLIDIPAIFSVAPLGALGCLAIGLVNGAFWALAPVFTLGMSDNTAYAAWFMTSAVVGGAIVQWPLGIISDRIGRRALLIAMPLASAALSIGLVAVAGAASLAVISMLGAVWGMFSFTLYAIAVAYSNDHAGRYDYVITSSTLLLMYGIGATVGPFAASAVIAWLGYRGLFAFGATIHLLLSLYAMVRVTRVTLTEPEETMSFGDALAAAQTASQVYEAAIQREESEPG
jgi:MFS family permease